MEIENQILKAVELGVHNKHPNFKISQANPAGGMCSHRKSKGKYTTAEISVPTGMDDRDLVIRWHELMHAKYSVNTPHCGSISANATEDVIIHLTGLSVSEFGIKFGHLFRSMAKVAMGDINGNIAPSMRASNSIRKLMMENMAHSQFYRSVFLRGFSLLMLVRLERDYLNFNTKRLAHLITEKVIKLAEEKPDTNEFWAGFESNLHNQGRSLCEYDSFLAHSCWTNEPMRCFTNQIIALSKRIAVAVDRKQTRLFNRHHALLSALIKAFVDNPQVGKIEGKAEKMPKGMLGSSTKRRVKYVENILTHKCCTAMAPYASPSSTGSGIRPDRLSKAVFGYPSVFTRRKQVNKPPSAIMLDMSGSMSWNAKQLADMCAILPSADVFIYSSKGKRGDIGTCDGTIERIASKGRRVGEMPKTGGGNGCDLQAMEKLLSFKGNVVLVSDLGFCGQGADAAALAQKLVDENKGRRLTVCESSEQAIKFFKERSKKGW